MKHWLLPLTLIGCATVANSQTSPILPSGLVTEIDPQFRKYGVEAYAANAPEFQSKVIEALGLENTGLSAAALPYSIVITNHAAVPITAVVIRLLGTGVNGQPIDVEQVQRLGNGAIFGAGKTLLFSHDSNLTQAFIAKQGIREAVSRASSGIATIARNQKTPGIVLDSVVFADGTVVGPDQVGIIARDQAYRAAEVDVMAKVEDQSITDDALLQWLASFAPRDPGRDARGNRDMVQAHKAIFASRAVVQSIQHQGRAATIEWIKRGWSNQVPQPASLHKVQ